MTCTHGNFAGCPCGQTIFPEVICNMPGQATVNYRVGDYVAFRHRLLQALPGEQELSVWRPGASGDLGVQMMEWWAYLADILTFYNERIANEAYLRTALLPESVNHLVQLLGYRPRPALGARGTLAALLAQGARPPLKLPARLQIQSKPGPGQPPQVFELEADTEVTAPDMVQADVSPSDQPLLPAGAGWVWLAGKVSGIKPGERLLLINAKALTAQTVIDYAWITVTGAKPQSDPLGNAVTQVSFTTTAGSIAAQAQASDYVLLRSSQSSPLWSFPQPSIVITATTADLASVARNVVSGSLVLFDLADGAAFAAAAAATAAATALQAAVNAVKATPLDPAKLAALATAGTAAAAEPSVIALASIADGLAILAQADPTFQPAAIAAAIDAATVAAAAASSLLAAAAALTAPGAATSGLTPTPVIVESYAEIVWYANGNGATPPSSTPSPVPAIAIPHAELGFASGSIAGLWQFAAAQITTRWGWTPVGQLAAALTAADLVYAGDSTPLIPAAGAANFPSAAAAVLLEDPAGNAASATAIPATPPAGAASAITLSTNALTPLPQAGLASPIAVFFDLLPVSRGKTVPTEILGSGNPTVAGQEFALTQAPVTYFADPASLSGDGFRSTVQISVNGVRWTEVLSFYGQPPNAHIYVLREDDQGQTHATFGDGLNGALLPTGANNVTASYRFGAGAAAPGAETLTVVLSPQPGLKSVRNPLPPVGGSDADPPAKLRRLAPRSVLTFNRAVSLDDYAAIAATASGVIQAVAGFAFDPVAQRPLVTLWIAGDSGALAAAQATIAGTAVPYQGLRIVAAIAVPVQLALTYVRDPRFDDAAVKAALTMALLDPDTGLLGVNVVGIGQPIYDSQIAATCLAVAGVTAIHNVAFTSDSPAPFRFGHVGGLRLMRFRKAAPACTGHRHEPGVGKYYVVPNDGQHLNLSGMTP